MDKKEIQHLRGWAKNKVKEGFTINQLKFALKRKGIEEKDAEKIVSRLGINYKFLVSLFVIMGLLIVSLVLLYIPEAPRETNQINMSHFKDLSFEGFKKSNTNNGLAFTKIKQNASPTVITLSLSSDEPDRYVNNFLESNLNNYKSFKPISRWAEGNMLGNDYAYQSLGKEFIVSQRLLVFNETLVDLSIRSERKLYNESREIMKEGVKKIRNIFS